MNLPEKYTESMKMMLGDEYDSYIESFNDKRLYGLRVNNLKISTEDFLKICPFKLEPVPWIEKMTSLLNTHIILQAYIIFRSLVP